MKKAGRRKFVLVEGDDTLVSFGGGILLDEFIHRLGLPELIARTSGSRSASGATGSRRLSWGWP